MFTPQKGNYLVGICTIVLIIKNNFLHFYFSQLKRFVLKFKISKFNVIF